MADVGDPGSTKPYNNATVGANWSTNLSNIPDSAKASYITSTRITAITIESPTISAGTVTGTTIQTSSSSNTGIKMSSAIGGMNVYGETIEIFDTSGTKYGTIGSGGAYLDIASYSNRNIRISPWGGTVFFGLNSGSGIAPTTSGQGYCALSSQVWATVYTNNVTIGSSYMNYSDSKMQIHSDTKINGSIYATGSIECTTARIKVGSYNLYPTTGAYDSSKYYLRS